jgi:predicted aspartyl protease
MRALALIALTIAALWPPAVEARIALKPDATGHLLVPVFVNGQGPYLFMLDTGADNSAVYAWFASEQHLAHGHAAQISGATGDAPETTTHLSKLALDGWVIHHVDTDTIPDRSDGVKIAGIAGADLLMGRLAVLDTGCETMSLLPRNVDPAGIAGRGATMIRAGSIKGGKQITLPVTVNGVAGVATLDTGARSTMINNTFAKAAGVDPASDAFQDGPPARGAVQKPIASRIGPIGTVSFAGLVRKSVVARVVDLPVFNDEGYTNGHALNIGVDILGGLRLTIDYSARRFWVAPSSCPVATRKP